MRLEQSARGVISCSKATDLYRETRGRLNCMREPTKGERVEDRAFGFRGELWDRG